MGRFHISHSLKLCHRQQRIGTVPQRRRRTQRHQRIHIGSLVDQRCEAIDEELLVDHHDGHRQDQLIDTDSRRVMIQNFRYGPPPHHVSHGHVHQRDQQDQRPHETTLHFWCFAVHQRIFLCSKHPTTGASSRSGAASTGVSGRRTVARLRHRSDDVAVGCRTFHGHTVGQKAHRYRSDTFHTLYCLFHVSDAGSTAHSCDIILFHSIHLDSQASPHLSH